MADHTSNESLAHPNDVTSHENIESCVDYVPVDVDHHEYSKIWENGVKHNFTSDSLDYDSVMSNDKDLPRFD
jgi:hypothetical protein